MAVPTTECGIQVVAIPPCSGSGLPGAGVVELPHHGCTRRA